ncbi:MAG: extracellular solute-binding protein [Fibrobacter sp.]|nr:extracellular solute-binding protein [Fibrobacter sp.]
MKRLSFCTGVALCLSLSAFAAPKETTLNLWTFTNELETNGAIARFEQQNPGVKVVITTVPNEQYLDKLRPVLRANKNAPDVFLGEQSLVKEIVETGFWDDLSKAPYKADVKDLVPYQVKMGTDSKGVLRALSWQTTPGGFFYRRSMAKQYLGTDDPKAVGEMINSPEKFIETARKIVKESNGEVKMIAGIEDYQEFPFGNKDKSFMDAKGKLVIDPKLLTYFDIAKTLRDEKLTADLNRWSAPWTENMKKDGKVFGYVLPTWGLHYVLKTNAPDAAGDYGLTSGPNPYFWGGTWLGIYSKSKNKDLAWKLVKMMTLDQETLKWWAKTTGDFVGNQTVFNEIKGEFSEPFLGGQNHYEFFATQAPAVNADIVCMYEQKIRGFFMNAINNYISGTKTKDEAIEGFKAEVKGAYPQLF